MADFFTLSGLRMSYGEHEVLRGINLSVGRSERVIVMGPSGSGKSTLLRCINHLEKPSAGSMSFDGRTIDLANWTREDIQYMRLHTSMVFQSYNLFAHMTALENVTEGLIHVRKMHHAEARELATHYLERTGMLAWKDCYPSTMSGGQQQRVGIARALALRPQLVMFDEPTSALDPELVGEVLGVMKQVAEEGIAMLVITHEVAFARDVADTVVVMDGGVILEHGTPQEVLRNPQNPRTRKFLNMLDKE